MLTRKDGSTRVARSLTHPGRRLLMGCDRNEFFATLQYTLLLCCMFYYVGGFAAVFLPPLWAWWRIRQLRKLGKNPYYFPVYRRTVREQGIYPQGRLPGAHGFAREDYHLPKKSPLATALHSLELAQKWIMSMIKAHAPGIYKQLAFDDPSHGLPDRIVYKYKRDPFVTEGRNGTLGLSFRYDCDDQTTLGNFQRALSVNEPLHTALRTLGTGWSWYSVYDQFEWDQPYPDKIFPTAPATLVDTEKRSQYERSQNYRSEFEFHLCYYPAAGEDTSKSGIYERNKRYQQDWRQAAYEKFSKAADQVVSALHPILNFTPLGEQVVENAEGYQIPIDTQLSSFKRAITGVRQSVRAAKPGTKLHNYLGYERLIRRGEYLRIGNMLIRPLTVVDYDDTMKPDVLEVLWNVPGNLRVVSRFIFEDKNKVMDEVNMARQQHQQKVDVNPTAQFKGGMQNVMQDRFAEEQVDDAEEAYKQASKDLTVFGYHTLTILVYQRVENNDEEAAVADLYKTANDVIGRLSNTGLTVSEELGQEFEAYLGAQPLNNVDNVVMPMLSARNAVNTIFTSNPLIGDPVIKDPEGFYVMANGEAPPCWAVFNAEHHKPYFFNPISGSEGGAGIIFGKTGVGKSGTVGYLANAHTAYTAMLPYGARQILIDKDGSHVTQAEILGGAVMTMNALTEYGMAPFYDLHTTEGFQFGEMLVTIMARQRGVVMEDKRNKEALFLSLKELAKFEPEQRTFAKLLQMQPMNVELRDQLRYYGAGNIGGNLFNGSRPIKSSASFMVFEIADLISNHEHNMLTVPGLLCLFNEIERMVKDAIPTVIFGEEAWLLLKTRLAAEQFASIYNRFRKYGAWPILIFQDPEQLFNCDFADEIIKNTAWFLVLPDERLGDEDVKVRMKKAVGLEPHQCDHLALVAQQDKKLFASGGGRRIGYFVKNRQARKVSLKLGDVGRYTCAVTSKAVIDRELAAFKSEFPGQGALGEPAWYDQFVRYKAGEHWYRQYRDQVLPQYESGEIVQKLEERCGLREPTHAA